MQAMLTRSVRVSEPALRLAERTLAEQGTTFSRLVRDVVSYVARTGQLPKLDGAPAPAPDERVRAFESWVDELVAHAPVPSDASYASAPARDLLSDALAERYE